MASEFLDDVAIEVQKARAKFPNGRHLLPALMEEVGELANALLEQEYGHGVSSEDVYREAVQVATAAMRIAEEGEPVFPKYQPAPTPDASDDPPTGETTAVSQGDWADAEDPAVEPESVEDREGP